MPDAATSLQERPAYFESGEDTLFGIVTEPLGPPRGIGVILLYGGGYTMSSHYNQYWTRLSRRLAGLGFHALRFDHHGNGDATGRVDQFDHRTPFSDDVIAAVHFLESEGVDRFLLVGDCLGGRGNLVASEDLAEVEGLFMISTIVRDARVEKAEDWAEEYGLVHYLRRAFRWNTIRNLASHDMRRAYLRVGLVKMRQVTRRTTAKMREPTQRADDAGASSRFLDPLETVASRGIAIRFVFSEVDDKERHAEFDQARGGRLGRILEAAGDRIEVGTIPGGLGDISDPKSQDAVIEDAVDWASRIGRTQFT